MTLDERQIMLKPVVEGYRKIPFMWATHDCALFAARCVDAQLGTRFEFNIQRDYRYSEAVSAVRLVKESGGWDAIIGRYLGPPVAPDLLQFGDVVLGCAKPPFERTTLLGICDEELFMVPDENGLSWMPMSQAQKGWRLADIAKRQREFLDV